MQDLFIIIALIFGGQALGSLFGLIKRPGDALLHSSLAFAGSMMIAISFVELMPQGLSIAPPVTILLSFIMGVALFVAADHAIPHIHPEFLKKECNTVKKSVDMLLIGISLHNIPEGLAVGIGFALDPGMGLLIAVGITIQDIPETLATIIPLYCLNKKKLRSFIIVAGTAAFELFGFLLGYFVLRNAPMELVGVSLAMAAGLMTYISLDELLPSAQLKERPVAGGISIALGVLVTLGLGALAL